MKIQSAFNSIKQERIDYFRQFTFDKPVIFTHQTNEELRRLGKILYKSISFLLENYTDFLKDMPRCEKDLQIFEAFSKYPQKVGTFRTDFVVDAQNNIKIMEMTTRQPLNGYFTSGFFFEIANQQAKEYNISDTLNCYFPLFKYIENYIGNASHVCVLKGNEKLEEINLYPIIFENAGIKCHIIPIEQIAEKIDLLNNAWVIEELTFNEIRSLPDNIINKLAQTNMHNNFLSLLHTHDKRFFALLSKSDFLDRCLSAEEKKLLLKYLVPTYMWQEPLELWEDAYENKNNYILKHQHKGKSVDIYAGMITEKEKWQNLFETGNIENYILQPFVKPMLFNGEIGTEKRNDYVAGTLLYFNDEYFGPGLFRTSSQPVTNITDNRKIAQLVVQENHKRLNEFHYL